jgi:DNA-binding response OmpR family regulator
LAVEKHFLIVEDNPEGQHLLSRTLARKFPGAAIQALADADAALEAARKGSFDAIIVHRAAELDGGATVKRLRAENPRVAIVMVSGTDRSAAALAAGADRFLHYDAWLNIGAVVAAELKRRASAGRSAE